MDIDTLLKLGFTVSGGQIDRGGKNYGQVTKTGVLLTPDGEDLVAALLQPVEAPAPVAPKPARAPKAPKAPAAEAPAPAPASELDLGDLGLDGE